MKMLTAVALAVSLFALAAAAQDFPRGEVFLGFDYTRVNSATDVPAFSANGGGGQFVFNFNRWIGAVADIAAVHNGNISDVHLDTTLTTYMFGPRVTIRNWSRVQPYGQIVFGGVYGSTSIKVNVPATPSNPIVVPPPVGGTGQAVSSGAVALRAAASQKEFAMALGGGLDIKINRWLSFRPIGLDWMLTRLNNLRSADDNNQHHLRYTTGFNFSFGGAQ